MVIDNPPVQSKSPHAQGRIIVKYKKNSAKAMNRLHSTHKITKSERVFKRLEKNIRNKSEAELTNEVKARFKNRSRRIESNVQTPELSDVYVLDLDSGTDEQAALNDFKNDPNVEYAEQDGIVTVQMTPNDPYYNSSKSWGQAYGDLWGLKKVQAGPAWDLTTGNGIVVAVVDTGIDYNHPDIKDNMWHNPGEISGNGIDDDGNGFVDDVYGYDFTTCAESDFWGTCVSGKTADNDPADGNGHGTHVSGTIAATGNNNLGVIGLAFNSKVMAVKGVSDGGSGFFSDLANALHYAADNGADVINLSWGGLGYSAIIEDAVNYANSLGCVVVAAAGNSNVNAQQFYPAGLTNVITVAAFDPNDQKAYFSNFGNKIDVAAPGVDILSLKANGTALGPVIGTNYARLNGTSMATPHVSALAALLLSNHPNYSPSDIRSALRQSADDLGAPGFDIYAGYGRINAFKALTLNTLDMTPPANISAVNDGTGADISATNNSFRLSANWPQSSDPESGISSYWYAIGTSPNSTDILEWTNNGPSVSTTQARLPLYHGTTYYFTVKASNGAGLFSFPTSSNGQWVNAPPASAYDPVLKAPACPMPGAVCDSGNLLNGMASSPGGAEPNQPNTIHDSCPDGTDGYYHVYGSLDRLQVFAPDGGSLVKGRTIRVQATIWAFSTTLDFVDIYYASDAQNPVWTYVNTLTPPATGTQLLETDYLVQAGPNLQAVRGVYRFVSPANPSPCAPGHMNDHDDLIFSVVPSTDTTAPVISTVTIRSRIDSAEISWFTDKPADARVEYGLTTSYGNSSPLNPFLSLSHSETITGLSAGITYHYRLISKDAAGNLTISNDFKFTNPSPPETPGLIQVPHHGDKIKGLYFAQTATGYHPHGISTELYIDGVLFVDGGGSNLYRWDTTQISTGPHKLKALLYDSNEKLVNQENITFIVDQNAPPTLYSVKITSPQDGAILNSQKVNIIYPHTLGSLFFIDGVLYGSYFGNGIATTTWDTSNYADGTHYITLLGPDPVVGRAEHVIAVTLNKSLDTPPEIFISTPIKDSILSGIITISGTAEDNQNVLKVEIRVDSGPYVLADGTTNWSLTGNTDFISDGPHLVTVRATDNKSNSSSVSAQYFIDHNDAIPPSIFIQSPPEGATLSGMAAISGTSADNHAVSKIEIKIDSGPYVLANGTTNWSLTGDTGANPSGPHEIFIKATDTIGNSTVAKINIIISPSADTDPPTLAILSPPDGSAVRGTILISGTAADARGIAKVELVLEDGTLVKLKGTKNWSVSGDTTQTSDGTHKIVVRVTDTGGNVSTASVSVFVINTFIFSSSFESAGPWSMPAAGSFDTGVSHSGFQSIKLTRKSPGTSTIENNPVISSSAGFQPGSAYAAEVWVRLANVTAGAGGQGARVLLDWMDGTQGILRTDIVAGNLVGTADWTMLRGIFSPPQNASAAKFRLQLYNSYGTVWFDDSSLSIENSTGPIAAPAFLTQTLSGLYDLDGDQGEEARIDETFTLHQSFAYPNPAHGDPKIRLVLGLADQVDLRIYNEAGDKIQEATLNQVSIINNQYAYECKVSNLPSGVYLYTAVAQKDGETIRVKGKFAIVK